MWRILRAELSTSKYIIFICCALPIIQMLFFWSFALDAFESSPVGKSLIANESSEGSTLSDREVIDRIRNRIAQGNTLMYISFANIALWLGSAYSILIKGYKKHLYRRRILLPITLKQLGRSRIIFWMGLYLVSFVTLILLSLLLAHVHGCEFNAKFWRDALSTGGFILCAIPASFIGYDLVGGFKLKYK